MRNKIVSPIGDDWEALRETLLTPEERAETDIRIALLGEIISARQANGLTQKELEVVSGVKQPVIARLERGSTDPQLSTLIKVLTALGKTLYIGDIKQGQV
ncbi:MAG: helix-turn-helix transcriptional regulator [Clostridiales bacterium]|jgi:DNA-binding XRE family transcriptional regulator|nr:helix-turn-helix transcriptional regulator [Clostridiales bacterium]MDR2711951.1 helix-turn-helix transcriptional regulator [Clostridiales bacterium]